MKLSRAVADSLRDWRASLTDIRPDERGPTLLMGAYGLLALTSYWILKPVRNSVFLERVGAENLPFVYILTAAAVTLLMVVYSRHVDRVRERTLLLGTFAFLALNLVGFWWWLSVAGESLAASSAFYVWGKLYPLLLVSQFYLVANLLFTPRQARRLFSFIGIGLILGGVTGSVISGWAVSLVGTESLLLVAAALLVPCAAIVVALAPRLRPGDPGSARLVGEFSRDAVQLLRGSTHLRTIAWILGLTIVASTLIDWQFNSLAERLIPGEDAKTAFFGRFFLGLNIASLLIQIMGTGLVLRRFGVGSAMLFLPLVLLVTVAGVLAIPVLLTAVLAKGAEGALRYSLDQSTRELLYLPVPAEVKRKVKPLIDLAVYRGGTGLAGVLLIVVVNLLDLPWGVTVRLVAGLTAICIGLWVAMTFRMRREFRHAIRRLIDVRDVELDDLVVPRLGAETWEEVRRALRQGKEDRVLYALGLLERYPRTELTSEVAMLLDHKSTGVRRRAADLLRQMSERGREGRPWNRLRDPSVEVRLKGISVFGEIPGGSSAAVPSPPDPETGVHAVVNTSGVAREGPDSDAQTRRVEAAAGELALSTAAEDRCTAARLIADAGADTEAAARLLLHLMDDEDPEVRRDAVRAAGRAGIRPLVPALLALLSASEVRAAAEDSLRAFGAAVHPELLSALANGAMDMEIRGRIPALLTGTATQETVHALLVALPNLEASLRHEVLQALGRLRRSRADLTFVSYDIEPELGRELQEAYRWAIFEWVVFEWAVSEGRTSGEPAAVRLLLATLHQRRWQAAERASRILGLQYSAEDLYVAFTALTSTDPLMQQNGIELLDSTLDRRHRELLRPLLDPERDLAAIADLAAEEAGLRPGPAHEALRTLAGSESDPWIACLAAAALGSGAPPESGFRPARVGERIHLSASAGRRDGRGATRPGGATAEQITEARGVMDIIERAELLGRTYLLAKLRTEDLAEIAALATERTYAPGEIVFEQGQTTAAGLYVVTRGAITATNLTGRWLFTATAGQTLGDLTFLDGLPQAYRAAAANDSCVLLLARDDFQEFLQERFTVVEALLANLSSTIRKLDRRLGRPETGLGVPEAAVPIDGSR